MSDYSLLHDARQKAQQCLSQARYKLNVHKCPFFLDVLSFTSLDKLSSLWYYDITITCDAPDITPAALLQKPAAFLFQTPGISSVAATAVRTVYGVVQRFGRVATSADETRYSLRLSPRIALMRHTKRSEIYLNQSVTGVVTYLLRCHGLEGADFTFRLSRDYPVRELITQWRETDLEFMQRLLAQVGIFWRFEMDDRLERDVVIFQDSQEHYQFGFFYPLRNPAGMNDDGQESLWSMQTRHNVVSGGVVTRDYNYRQPMSPLESIQSLNGEAGGITGEVYHYAEPFLSDGDNDSPETGAFYARLRHERLLNGRHTISGCANSPRLLPGQVVETDGDLPPCLKEGIVITEVRARGSRADSFSLEFNGIPYSETLCYRPPDLDRPIIAGTLPARVESTVKDDAYAWLDSLGRYRIKLDFDRSATLPGYAYLWLRLAKPYAGDAYGWHAPLLDGTEVSIAFDGGDPDRPYIAYAQHDSVHPDPVTRDNHTRNVWRTPANNKLRMEDRRHEEHIKLATEYGKSQLNLGYIVNGQRKPRGGGFELRTDEHGAVRAAKGLLLTADGQPEAQGQALEMTPAINRIQRANNDMAALSSAAERAGALVADIRAQKEMLEERLAQLQSAVLLVSAPLGVALTSGQHLQLCSAQNATFNAGRHLDMATMKNLSISVNEALRLFVLKDGATLIANQGEVTMEAQHNTLSLNAREQISITSTDDEIVITTPKTLTLNGGGSYLTLSECGIEQGSAGDFIIKAAQYNVPGAVADLPVEMPVFAADEPTDAMRNPGKWSSN